MKGRHHGYEDVEVFAGREWSGMVWNGVLRYTCNFGPRIQMRMLAEAENPMKDDYLWRGVLIDIGEYDIYTQMYDKPITIIDTSVFDRCRYDDPEELARRLVTLAALET